jgi:two-component system response regulator AdeR
MTATGPLVLIVEDEPEIASVLSAYFERDGFRTVVAGDGDMAMQHFLRLSPNIIILDINLPNRDGFEVLAQIRSRADTPIIMASAMGEDLDKLSAFRMGADDYVIKPFNPMELVARAKSVLRRGQSAGVRVERFETLEVDVDGHVARVRNGDEAVALDLTLTEFRLLLHMIRSPGRAFSRADLLDACFPDSDAVERTIDSHISNLRRKLAAAGAGGYCAGVRGVGYRLSPQ